MPHKPVMHATRGRIVLLLLVVVLVGAAVAATPAGAAPTPTTLTVTAQSATVTWGARAVLNGVLQTTADPPLPVDQQQVLVQYAAQSIGPWTTAATVTNTAALYSSGAYTYSWTAGRNLYWRMNFLGTAQWASTPGAVLYVKVKPAIGKPACPSSVKHGKKVTVSGSLKPRYPAGAKNVKVKAQRYASGKWKAYKTYTATTADSGSYSKYSVRLSISKTGKYRFYATTADTTTLAAGKSAYSRSMKVK
jgi:hypothetical protein